MKAYSVDLRQKIVDAYDKGNISQRKLAKQFGVATSFVQKILKQSRETGDLSPKVRQEQTPTKLNSDQLETLRQMVEAENDATLNELRGKLHDQTGVLIARSTVDRMVKRLGFTFKKKRSMPARKKVSESNANE